MEPHIRLKQWLNAAQLTQVEFARRCEYAPSNLNHILAGRLKPTLTLAVLIERETAGAIPVAAWADVERAA